MIIDVNKTKTKTSLIINYLFFIACQKMLIFSPPFTLLKKGEIHTEIDCPAFTIIIPLDPFMTNRKFLRWLTCFVVF